MARKMANFHSNTESHLIMVPIQNFTNVYDIGESKEAKGAVGPKKSGEKGEWRGTDSTDNLLQHWQLGTPEIIFSPQ